MCVVYFASDILRECRGVKIILKTAANQLVREREERERERRGDKHKALDWPGLDRAGQTGAGTGHGSRAGQGRVVTDSRLGSVQQ